MPGGGGSTGKVRTPVLPGFGKGRLHRLVGKRGALIQDPKDQRDPEYQEVFQRRQWQRFRLPLRAGPSPLIPPPQGTRAEENTGCRCLTPPWRTRRPSQPDLREAVPNHRAGAAGSARESSGGQFSFPDFCPRMFRSLAGSGKPRSGGPGARVCVCWEGSPPRRSRSASASPFPSAHGSSPSPEAARASAEQPRLRLPRFLPLALPRPRSGSCCGEAPGGRAARSAHGGGRRRPGSGRPCGREARAETLAPLSAFARLLPASRTPLAPTPSQRD